MSQITVPVSKFLRLYDYLSRIGVDTDGFVQTPHLAWGRLKRLPSDQVLPAQHYSRLYAFAVAQMQTLGQPVPWAAGVGSEAFQLMCHCMISGRTLGDALKLAARFGDEFFPLTRHRVSLAMDGPQASLFYTIQLDEAESLLVPQEWDRAESSETVACASGLLAWHALCGWLVGRSMELVDVHIAAPYLSDAYHRRLTSVFGCKVQYGAQRNTLAFPGDQLERRLVHTVDSLQRFLENAVYELIAIEQEPASTSAAIKSLISIDLPTGMPSFGEVADDLHMSESSLRRRLQREGSSYQSLKDEVRCQVAIDKLINENARVADLASYLGFTEPSSFVRSFKSWTGETPKSYRDRLHALGQE
tara:strand:- start:60945 stop:62024 length:1080 start_codon:yes stop_codon:yes gene_type:complete